MCVYSFFIFFISFFTFLVTADYESEDATMNFSDSGSAKCSVNSVPQVDDADDRKVHRDLAKFFCDAALPPVRAADHSFTEFIRCVNPNFHAKVDMLETCCFELHDELKSKVKEILGNLDCKISLSADILKYGKHNFFVKQYLCLTARFIDQNWKLKKCILKFCNAYSGELPSEVILKSLEDWGIENKISAITMVESEFSNATEVKDKIQGNGGFQRNGFLFRVKCCGNMISQMVQDSYEKIKDITRKIFQLYPLKSLPLWYLTSSHLKDALKMNSMGEFSSQDVLDDYDVPSADEWEKVRSLCKLVEDIYAISKSLFEAKCCTANIYIIIIFVRFNQF